MGSAKKDGFRNFTVTLSREWSEALDREARERGVTRAAALVDRRWHGYLPGQKDSHAAWRGRRQPLAEPMAAMATALVGLGLVLRFEQDASAIRQEMRRLEHRIISLPRRMMSVLAETQNAMAAAELVATELRAVRVLADRLDRLIRVDAPHMPSDAQRAAVSAQKAIATAVALLAPRLSTRVEADTPTSSDPKP